MEVGPDEEDERFLNLSKDVAECFLSLQEQPSGKSPGQPPAMAASLQVKSLDSLALDRTSMEVARKLREIGDSIQTTVDAELSAILVKQPVMEMGLEQFNNTCRLALVRCSDRLSSGWQQVYTVYYSMTRVIRELREQPNLPDQARKQREVHIQRFVGPVMQDIGLDAWIQAQGGLNKIQSPPVPSASSKVAVYGTPV